MRCDCKVGPTLATTDVDFAYYVHCPACGKPWLIEPTAGSRARGTRAKEDRPREPLPPPYRTSKLHGQRITDDPLRSADFVVDGRVRGGHWPEHDADGRRYVASVRLRGRLPATLIEPRRRPSGRPRPGVAQKLNDTRANDRCLAWSAGSGFPSRLCALAGAREALVEQSLQFVEVNSELDHSSALIVAGTNDDVCLALAEALVPTADALIEQGVTFADALFEQTGVGSDEAVSPETVGRLVARVAEATNWVSGHAARVGNSIEARLALSEIGELAGTLRVPWRDGAASVLGVELDASLPTGEDGALEVWAESSALASRLRARFEPSLGDKALDDALHVKGALDKAPELLAARELCLRLAAARARVVLDGARLKVSVPAAERDHQRLHGVVEDAVSLWHRVALGRLGVGE